MIAQGESTVMVPNEKFGRLASDEQISSASRALQDHGIRVFIASNAAEARTKLFEWLPAGAEVFLGSSVTLAELGVAEEINNSGRYDSVRVRLAKMDSAMQNREMIKMGAVPEYIVGSVHAVSEDGIVIVASNTGSQLAPYAASAARVIWVVGTQKIVRNQEEGLRRVYEYSLPLEDARLMKASNFHSQVRKLLIVKSEITPGRTSLIFVKEKLGF